jgi:hypothetical protein
MEKLYQRQDTRYRPRVEVRLLQWKESANFIIKSLYELSMLMMAWHHRLQKLEQIKNENKIPNKGFY